MYIPEQFAENNIELMHGLIRAHPLATLVTFADGAVNANHIPLHLSARPPYGRLCGHVARANPLLHDIAHSKIETLAIFHGPEAYISPSWYSSKHDAGKVVPTWNYTVAHAYGLLRMVDDAKWLETQLAALTLHNEAAFPVPWAVTDAPPEFIAKISSAIVGIEMDITRLLGKWKVSQNQPMSNQVSVVNGLRASGLPNAVLMADLVADKISMG